MKRLDRYMFKEMLPIFFGGTLVMTLLFLGNYIIWEFRFLNIEHVPWVARLQLLFLRTPFFLQMTLPVGAAMAGAMAMSRLVRESELTVIRASGASIRRILIPFIAMGCVVGLVNYGVTEVLMPRAEKRFRSLTNQVGLLGVLPNFASNKIFNLDKYTVSVGSIRRRGDSEIELGSVIIIERPRPNVINLTTADTGEYVRGVWTMPNARQYTFDKDDLLKFNVGKITIQEKVVIQDILAAPEPDTETAASLKQKIQSLRAIGQRPNDLETKYYARFSVPFACVIFGFVSPLFAVRYAKSGGVAGLILSLFLVFLYYNAFMISTEVFGKLNWVPGMLAAWLPNLLFIVLALFGIRRLE